MAEKYYHTRTSDKFYKNKYQNNNIAFSIVLISIMFQSTTLSKNFTAKILHITIFIALIGNSQNPMGS